MGNLLGTSESSAKIKVDTRAATNALVRGVQNSSTTALVKQELIISGNNNFIRDIKQKQVINLKADSKQILNNLSDIQNEISNALSQAAEAVNVGMLGALTNAESNVNAQIKSDVMTNITSETIQNIINTFNATQSIVVSGNDNVVRNVEQEQVNEALFGVAQDTINKMDVVNKINNSISQDAKAEQKNPIEQILNSINDILSGLANSWVIVVVVIAIVVAFIFVMGGKDLLNKAVGVMTFGMIYDKSEPQVKPIEQPASTTENEKK